MDASGFGHHHGHGCERQHACPAQLAGTRHVPHVADAAEHQRVEAVAFHAVENLLAPVGAQTGEVDARVVLEAHRPDEHTAIAWVRDSCDDTVRFVSRAAQLDPT